MITLILYTHNQSHTLKQTLHSFTHYFKHEQCLLIDDHSSDQTENYVRTHFPDIHYFKTQDTLGFQQAINRAATIVQTPYMFICNPSIDIKALCLPSLEQAHKQDPILAFPIHNKKATTTPQKGIGIYYQSLHCQLKPFNTQTPSLCFFSEAISIQTELFKSLGGLPSTYNSIPFSWLHLIFKANRINIVPQFFCHQVLIKKDEANSCFTEYYSIKDIQIDSWVFEWTFLNNISFKWRRLLRTLLICFSFKPRNLWALLQAFLFYSWKLPKQNINWYSLTNTEILKTTKENKS